MIREHFSLFRKMEMLLDVALAALAFYWVAYPSPYTYILPVFLAIWMSLLFFQELYASFRIKEMPDVLLTIWSSALVGVGIFAAVAYLLKMQDFQRFFVIYIFFGAAVLTSIEKAAAMIFFRYIRRKGFNFRNILIVGTGPRAQQFMDLVNRRGEWGLKIIGLIDEDTSLMGKEISGFKVIGALKDVAEIVHNSIVDEIVFIIPRSWFYKIDEVITFCETEGIRVHVAIDVFDLKFSRAKQTDLENFLLLTFERTPVKVWHLVLKRTFDFIFSGMLLVILSPLFLTVALAIKLTSQGPVLYKQTRCSMNGRRFTLFKFRTMVVNAEALLPQLLQKNEMSGPAFKMANDPRVTPLGKFLRKTSIDELPQLWNVFKGDMSIVGPRPPLPEEVKRYDSWQRRRLSMRPGITCLWQVQGRNKITDFNEWTRLDLEYIDHWSILGDLRILAQTVPTVILGIGAK